MKTIALKFNNIECSRLIITILAIALFALVSVYSYFINASVSSVVERENTEKAISILNSNLSELDSSYFMKIDNMNMKLAMSMGFYKTKNTSFAVRKTMAKQLVALNNF